MTIYSHTYWLVGSTWLRMLSPTLKQYHTHTPTTYIDINQQRACKHDLPQSRLQAPCCLSLVSSRVWSSRPVPSQRRDHASRIVLFLECAGPWNVCWLNPWAHSWGNNNNDIVVYTLYINIYTHTHISLSLSLHICGDLRGEVGRGWGKLWTKEETSYIIYLHTPRKTRRRGWGKLEPFPL